MPTAEIELGTLNKAHALKLCEVALILLPRLSCAKAWNVWTKVLLQFSDALLNRTFLDDWR